VASTWTCRRSRIAWLDFLVGLFAPVSCFISGQTASVVRCLPGEDATNGFFVSCFVRGQKRKSDLVHDHDHEVTVPKKKRKKKKKNVSLEIQT
jgi:putative methyltransferase